MGVVTMRDDPRPETVARVVEMAESCYTDRQAVCTGINGWPTQTAIIDASQACHSTTRKCLEIAVSDGRLVRRPSLDREQTAVVTYAPADKVEAKP